MNVMALYDAAAPDDLVALTAELSAAELGDERARALGGLILAAGWPDARPVGGALTDPVEPIVVTRSFEDLARG